MSHSLLQETSRHALPSGPPRAFYLALQPDPVFAVFHPPTAAPTGVGIVLCPPFGWAELCVHRSLRAWAEALAGAGHAALRIDFPGTGDSGGTPRDPARLEAWKAAADGAADWLRSTQACDRVVAIGIGLGGMVALAAVADGAAIDDLVLWGVPRRGRLLLRELRTFARMSSGEDDGEDGGSVAEEPSGAELEVSGFVLSPETVRDLEDLDLTKLELPPAEERRILLLGRDTLGADRRLGEHLEESGVAVTLADGLGYGKMLTHPQYAVSPVRVFERTLAWLAAGGQSSSDSTLPLFSVVSMAYHASVSAGEVTVREAPFEVDFVGRRLSGVLATPLAAPPGGYEICAVLLNAGAVRRIGPNRMWVECARRWAALGVPTLRLDGVAFGDSDGDERRYYQTSEFYRDDSLGQIRATLDQLEAHGLPPRFLLAGLCSSAYWGLRAALVDARVRSLILVNPWSFVWSDELAAARDGRRAQRLLRSGAWRDVARLAVSEGRLGRLARAKARRVVSPRSGGQDVFERTAEETDRILDQLERRDVSTLLLLSDGEALTEDFRADGRLEQLQRWPTLRYERIPIHDHIFRPAWAQAHVHDAFDGALVRARHDATRAHPPL